MKPIRVVVTAVGGDLGQAVVKALRLSALPFRIHGCDLHPDSFAGAFVDSYHAVPRAADPRYVSELDALCARVGANAVVPASLAEIDVLGGERLPSGVPVISQRRECLSVFDDKLLGMRALRGAVELAAFADGTNDAEVDELVRRTGFPLVVKGRRSSGSRTLHVVHSTAELSGALANVALPLVQAYLDDAGGEFSAGIFRSTVFDSTIVFRRKLGPGLGLSWEAEVVDAEEIGRYAENVARLVTAAGSVNVQVRLTEAGPRLLEVNPRFSSLVAARAAAGFEDVDWSLRLALGLPLEPPAPFRRLRFRRFFGEVVDTGKGFGGVPEWLPRCLPARRHQ